MRTRSFIHSFVLSLILVSFLLTTCSSPASTPSPEPAPLSQENTKTPEWFGIELTDVQTGEVFTMNDFSGKVVLVETMAMWCPNCLFQANEVRKMHALLEKPDDLISISLDVDINEDGTSLKDYTKEYDFEWRFAIAPLEVARALGNLYSAQYLNPPLSPMLIIDRNGEVHQLEYGQKNVDTLLESVKPFLNP